MGAVPSTPSLSGARPQDTAGYLIGSFVGEKSFPIGSDFWQKLLELPLNLHWPTHRVHEACKLFAQNNCNTRHLAKILIHLSWCLQECVSNSGALSEVYAKALNAVYISSIFLKYLIENAQSNSIEEFHVSLNESEPAPNSFKTDQNIVSLVMHNVLNFIGSVEVSPNTYLLHQELLNFMLVAMSTQLLYGPAPGPTDMNPFIDAAMAQESSLVRLVVRRLLLNYIIRPRIPFNSASYPVFSGGSQPGVLQRVSSAAATFVLLPFNYLVSSTGDGPRNPLADISLHVLLILNYYRKSVVGDESLTDRSDDSATSDSLSKGKTYFSDNPYCKALEIYRGECAQWSHVRLPFASLFDTLGMCLADETAVLLLYTLVHGNSDFLEYVLVRTDLDTLLMPILETLYNASKRTSNHIYILLIILLILSQDSSFNASIHKMVLPSIPWYQEHLLHRTSLGSLMVIILIRTVKYNLSKLRVWKKNSSLGISFDRYTEGKKEGELHCCCCYVYIFLELKRFASKYYCLSKLILRKCKQWNKLKKILICFSLKELLYETIDCSLIFFSPWNRCIVWGSMFNPSINSSNCDLFPHNKPHQNRIKICAHNTMVDRKATRFQDTHNQ
ncbi:dymeclin [Salix suchowensis]|nr:dymeclin [Salix suchowensis]